MLSFRLREDALPELIRRMVISAMIHATLHYAAILGVAWRFARTSEDQQHALLATAVIAFIVLSQLRARKRLREELVQMCVDLRGDDHLSSRSKDGVIGEIRRHEMARIRRDDRGRLMCESRSGNVIEVPVELDGYEQLRDRLADWSPIVPVSTLENWLTRWGPYVLNAAFLPALIAFFTTKQLSWAIPAAALVLLLTIASLAADRRARFASFAKRRKIDDLGLLAMYCAIIAVHLWTLPR